jgi:hypothetical protein
MIVRAIRSDAEGRPVLLAYDDEDNGQDILEMTDGEAWQLVRQLEALLQDNKEWKPLRGYEYTEADHAQAIRNYAD